MSDDELQRQSSDFDWGGPDLSESSDVGVDVVRFTCSHQTFAIEATSVREIVALAGSSADVGVEIVALPGLTAPIRGVTMLRRQAVAVIDLAQWLGLDGNSPPSDFAPRILVVESENLVAGLLCDTVQGFESWTASADDARPSQNKVLQEISMSARWAPGGVLTLLNVAKILAKVAVR